MVPLLDGSRPFHTSWNATGKFRVETQSLPFPQIYERTPLTVRNRSSPPTGPTMRYPKSARIPIGCSSNVNMPTLSAQRSIRSTVQGLFAKLWPSENEI